MERLQKILSQWGVASRRQAEQMIADGRVRLNGNVAELGQKADPAVDRLEVDGQPIQPIDRPPLVYLLLHKPAGIVTTCNDPQRRRTVLDLLPQSMQHLGIHPVGRLDSDSTGALLLTNDGDVTFCLTHPRHSIVKIYQVWVQGNPPAAILQQWRQGVVLNGRLTRPAQVRVLQTAGEQTLLEIALKEGRNRQIRRVAAQLGYPVVRLHRVAIESIDLGQLPPSQFRSLTQVEVQFLQGQVKSFRQPTPNLAGSLSSNAARSLETQLWGTP